MASSASLVVRISADINSFSRQLSAMTKDVDRASKKLSDVGKTMSLAITVPALLAGAALAKMALENEAVGNKFDRVFGPAAARVNNELQRMMKIVPETGTDLQRMANETDEFASNLGMAAPKAALMSESLMKMAAELSSDKMISMTDAVDDLRNALAGQTRGLKQVGIVIEPTQVKMEALRLGLMRTGDVLSPLGTALATYSLLVQRSGQEAGTAAARHAEVGRQLEFVKRDLSEFADATSNLVLPALRAFAGAAAFLADALNKIPDWIREVVLAVVGMAAVIGPTIIIVAKLTEAIVTLRAATQLLAEGSAIKTFLGLLTNPAVIVSLLAIAAAIGVIIALWHKFHKETAATKVPDLGPLANVKDLLGGATTLPKDPMAELRDGVDELTESFNLAMRAGMDLTAVIAEIGKEKVKAAALVSSSSDPKVQLAAAKQYNDLQDLLATANVASTIQRAGPNGGAGIAKAVGVAAHQQSSPELQRFQLASRLVADELQLEARELAVTVNAFDATRVATLELKEKFKQASNDFATGLATFKLQVSSLSGLKSSALAGLQDGLTGMLAALSPVTLVFEAIGKIMQGFQPVIDNLLGPLVAFGQIMALIVEPILRPLFESLKIFGIAVALVGEVVYTVAGGIAKAIGHLISAIGAIIAKIPFLGGIGHKVQQFGNSITDLGNSALNSAKKLDQARIQLQNLQFDDAANGLTTLAGAAQDAAQSLYNLPQAFKINLERFRATAPIDGPYVSPTSASSSLGALANLFGGGAIAPGMGLAVAGDAGGAAPGAPLQPTPVLIDGREVAQIVWGHVRNAATRQFGNANRALDVAKV